MNARESQTPSKLWGSDTYADGGRQDILSATILDDFTPAVSGTVNLVSWQGGYCGVPRGSNTPQPVASSFQLAVIADRNGAPATRDILLPSFTIWEGTFNATVMRQDHLFDIAADPSGFCARGYYEYTLPLPQGFAVEGGKRYWLRIVANMLNSGVAWGWREGTADNGVSFPSYAGSIVYADLAFALSS